MSNYVETPNRTTLVGSGDVQTGRSMIDFGIQPMGKPLPAENMLYAYEVESMVLQSNAGFPSERGTVVKIDDELILADRTAGNELRRLTRGYDGTIAADHARGAVVTLMQPITAWPRWATPA